MLVLYIVLLNIDLRIVDHDNIGREVQEFFGFAVLYVLHRLLDVMRSETVDPIHLAEHILLVVCLVLLVQKYYFL